MQEVRIDFKQIKMAQVEVSKYIQELYFTMNSINDSIVILKAHDGSSGDADEFMNSWSDVFYGNSSVYYNVSNRLSTYAKSLKKAHSLYVQAQNFAFDKAYRI